MVFLWKCIKFSVILFLNFKYYIFASEITTSESLSSSTNINSIELNSVNSKNEKKKFERQVKSENVDPLWYLNKFGYLDTLKVMPRKSSSLMMMPSSLDQPISNNQTIENAIKKFQKYANLNVTGKLDRDTIKMMKTPRCGHPDLVNDSANKTNTFLRKKRYALQGSKWSKSKLRFKVGKYPKFSSMPRNMIDQELKRALNLWSEASDVEFEQIYDPADNKESQMMRSLLVFDSNGKSLSKDKSSEAADIDVRFETGYHGDSEPFDGSGLILGHAYFPEFGGSTHFDADELWTARSPEGVNLYQVAVHEFGHALGLEHSDNFDAIMAPFFRGYAEEFRLHPDDLTAIELLYGKSKRNANQGSEEKKVYGIMPSVYENENKADPSFTVFKPWKPSAVTKNLPEIPTKSLLTTLFPVLDYQTPAFTSFNKKYTVQQPEYFDSPTSNKLCLDGKFDAITLQSDGYTYVFKDVYVYRIDSNFVLDNTYPRLISNVFRGWNGITFMTLPNNIDTILFLPDTGMTYFFKNNLYWRSSKIYSLDPGYPRIISEDFKGLDTRNGFNGKLDASFVWSGNGRVYFIEGDRYWRYDFDTSSIETGYPKKLSIWRGLPPKITDAFLWINGATYFFDNEKYYRFNDLAFKVDSSFPSYPRFNSEYWFGCNNLNRYGKLMLSTSASLIEKRSTESIIDNQEYEKLDSSKSFFNSNYSVLVPTTATMKFVEIQSLNETDDYLNLGPNNNTEEELNQVYLSNKLDSVNVNMSNRIICSFNLIFFFCFINMLIRF